jgi:hypothetical protein
MAALKIPGAAGGACGAALYPPRVRGPRAPRPANDMGEQPAGVVPAVARAGDVARGAEIAWLRVPPLLAAGQAGSQRKPLLSSQMMASPFPAMPLMPASACGQNSPGS